MHTLMVHFAWDRRCSRASLSTVSQDCIAAEVAPVCQGVRRAVGLHQLSAQEATLGAVPE
jgi:hypothetical protein